MHIYKLYTEKMNSMSLSETLNKNTLLQSKSLDALRGCFEDTTGHDPGEWLWSKDQIINEVLFHMNEEYRADFFDNLQDY